MTWNFGGAFAETEGTLQQNAQKREAFPLEQKKRMQDLAAGQVELDQAPIKAEQVRAAARLNNANASILENTLATTQRMSRLSQGFELKEGESPSAALLRLAALAAKGGDGGAAQELIKNAAQAQASEALTALRGVQMTREEARLQAKMAERYGQLLGTVRGPEDFARANAAFEQEFGEVAPQMEYDPEMVRVLRDSAIKYRDQVYAEHLKVTEEQAERRIRDNRNYRGAILQIRRDAETRKAKAAEADDKNAGKDVGAPTRHEITYAENMTKLEPKTKDMAPEDRRVAAFDIAARAKGLRRNNPGLSADEAAARAFAEMQAEGYFSTMEQSGLRGVFGGTRVQYGKPGASASKPLDVPVKDGKPDVGALKPSMFYKTPKGVLQFLGQGRWKAPEPNAPRAPARSTEPDEDEDDEN